MVVMDTNQFQQQLQGLWSTRPYRPDDRTVAGVCTGIAARYRVDPTLVKVAFVVAAFFGGSGLILYLAAWVAFPGAQRARADALRATHAGSAHGGHRGGHGSAHGLGNPQVILLVVLAIVVVTSIGPNRTWGSGGLLGAILMLGGWFLLYLRTPTPPVGTSIDTAAVTDIVVPPPAAGQFERWVPRGMGTSTGFPESGSPAAGTPPTGTETPGALMTGASTHSPSAHSASAHSSTAHPVTPTPRVDLEKNDAGATGTDVTGADVTGTEAGPPAWDPLGAARFAWDLPEPTVPAEPARRRRRSPLTLLVAGLAVIVGAIGAALHQIGVDWFTAPHILSLCLAVVGAGLLVAAVLRRRTGEHSTGLVPIGIALGVAVIVTTLASGVSGLSSPLPSGGAGERNWKPLTENDIQPEYTLGAGEMTLDLREVELTADRKVRLENGLGVIKVQVPDTMNVRASCNTGVGEVTCPTGLDGGRDGTDGPVLEIDARTGMGEVQVLR
ncbi:PspC domain-containing protein [Gordonia sp. zg691]|uniref:PspC domain-containing protein n=1 Tax=Gordonia jinghuaiqii TaxID=2758710 RepID=UPI0016622A85|nr:PspC domain-containing protein [Gordonia jinghuaiqii]MBD0863875.1 PspC domain-containing protein [Gordonia jinghuaiqii]